MGIPGFNGWFYENNKQAYQPMAQTTVDHLYIDMNSVLHNVLRKGNIDKYFYACIIPAGTGKWLEKHLISFMWRAEAVLREPTMHGFKQP